MCGRFYVDDELAEEMEHLVRQIDAQLHGSDENRVKQQEKLLFSSRDVYPSQFAPVLMNQVDGPDMKNMQWGLQQIQGKGLLINARSETVTEKKMFQNSIINRRCVIPARHYYEWDSSKNKVSFTHESGSMVLMAGIYQRVEEEDRFVILTTQANESAARVHSRMPMILSSNEVYDWFYGKQFHSLLKKVPPVMKQYQEFEQATLPFV